MKIGKTQQKVLEIIDIYKEFELLEYIKGKSPKVRLKCNNCGYIFERYSQHFVDYSHICPKCHPKGTSQRMKLEEAQKRVDAIYGENNLKLLEYIGNNSFAKVKCLKCGKVFERVPTVLWRGRTRGCPECTKSISLGEQAIKNWLENKKIQYIQQYRFSDCKYKTFLPFDFYLPQHNVCIEFQGEQHYKERSRYYTEDLKTRDEIKKNYCLKHNIIFIEIPYYDINNLDKYLLFIGKK